MDIDVSFSNPLRVVIEVSDKRKGYARFSFQSEDTTVEGENMSATMQVATYATLSVQWKDKAGNPAKVDGPTTWTSSDPDIIQATVATGNDLICNLYAPGEIGKATIHANADADMGEGVKAITSSIDVEAIQGEAIGGEIKFSQSGAQGGATTGAGAQGGQTGPTKPPPPKR